MGDLTCRDDRGGLDGLCKEPSEEESGDGLSCTSAAAMWVPSDVPDTELVGVSGVNISDRSSSLCWRDVRYVSDPTAIMSRRPQDERKYVVETLWRDKV